jgi:hypothetical protein
MSVIKKIIARRSVFLYRLLTCVVTYVERREGFTAQFYLQVYLGLWNTTWNLMKY